jgi:hypothetical protein
MLEILVHAISRQHAVDVLVGLGLATYDDKTGELHGVSGVNLHPSRPTEELTIIATPAGLTVAASASATDTATDALALANATDYGLSSGVVTTSLESAVKAIKGIRAGTVNINEVPGYRLESTPFGGIKDSGLGIKEGVVEAMRFMSTVKTYSLPW